MATLVRRAVTASDWPSVLVLANASVVHVAGAGSQEEWYENRRSFDSSRGTQDHYVLVDPELGEIVGYGGVETTPNGEFRMFVVTVPELLETVGERLFRENVELAKTRGAERIWFTEHAHDTGLVEFAKARDFMELGRIRLDEGVEAITLMKRLS